MMNSNTQDGFKELLQTQVRNDVPDFLEQNIMAKIEPAPQKSHVAISLQSIFILSSLASVYLLVLLASVYYYPNLQLLQDLRTGIALLFLVKLSYDLNEILPHLFQQISFSRKLKHG